MSGTLDGGARTSGPTQSAAVVATTLIDPSAQAGRAWTPTGTEALAYDEVADILTEILGRTVSRPGALRYLRHARSELAMPTESGGPPADRRGAARVTVGWTPQDQATIAALLARFASAARNQPPAAADRRGTPQ